MKNENWVLLKTEPSKNVYMYLSPLKIYAVILTVLFLLVAILITLPVSQRIYRPFKKLVNEVAESGIEGTVETDMEDEISYLNHVYRKLNGKVSAYNHEKYEFRDIVQSYRLKKLLLESSLIQDSEMEKVLNECLGGMQADNGFYVCVFKIDYMQAFMEENSLEDRKIIRFALINVAAEVISEKCRAVGVDMDEDHVVIIVNSSGLVVADGSSVDGLKRIQDFVQEYYHISVTVAVGRAVKDIRQLSGSYRDALKYSANRFIIGRKSILTGDTIQGESGNAAPINLQKLVSKLAEHIKNRNMEGVERILNEIGKQFGGNDLDSVITALLNLAAVVVKALTETVPAGSGSIGVNYADVSRMIFETETMEDYLQQLLAVIGNELRIGPADEAVLKDKVIADTVVEIIQRKYPDNALCFNQIAEMLKINSRRLSRIFKECTGMSIAEYINDYRLERAAELLEKTSYNVGEIIDKVGVENDTYFYSIFKKKYGTTPKEYVAKKCLILK